VNNKLTLIRFKKPIIEIVDIMELCLIRANIMNMEVFLMNNPLKEWDFLIFLNNKTLKWLKFSMRLTMMKKKSIMISNRLDHNQKCYLKMNLYWWKDIIYVWMIKETITKLIKSLRIIIPFSLSIINSRSTTLILNFKKKEPS